MHPHTLGLAAALAVLVFPAAAAQAQAVDDGGSVRIHRGGDGRDGRDGRDHRDRHDGLSGQVADASRFDRRARTDVIMDWNGGEWALYNNRTWQSDSYNDWWHDHPWRSFPRWVSQNGACNRQWYSADVLRC
jgi:hypothetical protein